MFQRVGPALFLVAAAACSYTDPGTGSGTLQVRAQLHYDATATNQSSPQTAVQITLTKNGAAVPTPNISLQDADTQETFVVSSATNSNSITADPTVFNTTINGYHRRMALSISAGSDNVQVKLEGPGPFTVASPLPGAQVQLSGGLQVEWDTEDGVVANQVGLSLPADSNQIYYVPDTGSYNFSSNRLHLGSNSVTVTRINKVTPAGAVGNSVFQSDYEVDASFQVNS